MTKVKLHPIKGGFAIRLRVGAGQHQRFRIALTSATEAQDRGNRMAALAHMLVSAGKSAEALVIVRKLGQQTTDAGAAEVEAFARELAGTKAAKGTGQDAPMTFESVARAWTSGELARRFPDHIRVKRSAESDKIRLGRLYPVIGSIPIRAFTKADAKRAMSSLPEGRRSATRRQYGQVICRVLRMAVWPLELIDSSPIPPGFLPRVDRRSRPPLYPSEDAKLLRCPDVPRNRRLLYGLLAREGLRLGEALGLRWRDLDLSVGAIRLDRTKNGARSWALRPDVAEALRSLKGEPHAYVFPGLSRAGAAKQFRSDLTTAKVDREDLFVDTPERTRVCVHSLRATFITVALANGATETWVADRTGHRSSDMINGYRQPARRFTELQLGPLQPLDQLLGCAKGSATEAAAPTEKEGFYPMMSTEFRCRDSNSDSGIQSPLSYP